MRDGSDRAEVPYVRPSTLLLPRRPPKLVFLDLNHWISLAKAHAGVLAGEEFRGSLDACLGARHAGVAVFPIADTTFIEISKIPRPRQRRHLRDVIEQLSGYAAITARVTIARHEIEAMLDKAVGPRRQPIDTADYLGWGVVFAFGRGSGRLRVWGADGSDVTEDVRAAHPAGADAFDAKLAAGELLLQRTVLEGPTPETEPALRQRGWAPRGAMRIAMARAQQELDQVARFDEDPRWRRGRVRDVVAAREILIEIQEPLLMGLTERGIGLEDAFGRVEEARRHFDAMPSFDVAVSLKTEYHRDGQHQWTPNDIHDIDALGSSLPYCDVVLTDKAAASHANRTGLAERLGTTVLSRLDELADVLARG